MISKKILTFIDQSTITGENKPMGNIFGSADTNQAEIPLENDYFNPKDSKTEWKWHPQKFDSTSQKWIYTSPPKETLKFETLSIVTFNVWFDQFQKMERLRELMNICRDKDIICLQEVTTNFLKGVLEIDWVKKSYFVSDVFGSTVSPYGVMILSKLHPKFFTFHKMPTKMSRYFLLMHLNVNNQDVEIGTVHLESLSNRNTRKEQLELISKTLKADTSLFMGDFNFCSYRNYVENDTSNLENEVLKELVPEFKDIWAELSKEKGYTFDTTSNKMIEDHKFEQMRYDRIVIRSKEWKPIAIDIIGDKEFKTDEYTKKKVYPSDHYGLITQIKYEN